MKVLERASRALTFGRHIPPTKLLRRLTLAARRRWRDRFGRATAAAATRTFAERRPQPLFAPRTGQVAVRDGDLVFTFLNHARSMGAKIDWKPPENQLWRMNLHYMEYLEEVDDGRFLDLVRQWIAANPPQQAGNWRDSWCSYALSLRVVVWMQEIERRGIAPSSEALAPTIASLITQMRFLEKNLETDIGGNHLVKNIKALLWASAFFGGPKSARWRRLGLKLLQRALAEQVLSDGVHYERSPSYHCQAFADLLECRRVLALNERVAELDDALRRMSQATVDLAHPDGRVAQFNDAGLHMSYSPSECLDAYHSLYAERPQPRAAFALDSAGYYGLRSNGNYFIADCGRIAPDDLPAHGHGDILSFEWSVAGARVVVDPGVFEYAAGEKRARSRAASSHNTLCFEGTDQADFFGAFRCGRRPDSRVLHHEAQEGRLVLEGTHDGFAALPGAPRHIRRFEVSDREIIVVDRVEGQPDRSASVRILLHPDVRVERAGAALRLAREAVVIELTSQMPMTIEDAVSWPDMGFECQTKRVRIPIELGVKEVATRFRVERV